MEALLLSNDIQSIVYHLETILDIRIIKYKRGPDWNPPQEKLDWVPRYLKQMFDDDC